MTPRQKLTTSNDDVLICSNKHVVAATKVGSLITIHFANFSLEIQTNNEGEAAAYMNVLKTPCEKKETPRCNNAKTLFTTIYP